MARRLRDRMITCRTVR